MISTNLVEKVDFYHYKIHLKLAQIIYILAYIHNLSDGYMQLAFSTLLEDNRIIENSIRIKTYGLNCENLYDRQINAIILHSSRSERFLIGFIQKQSVKNNRANKFIFLEDEYN